MDIKEHKDVEKSSDVEKQTDTRSHVNTNTYINSYQEYTKYSNIKEIVITNQVALEGNITFENNNYLNINEKIPMIEWKPEIKNRSYDPIMKMLLQFVSQRRKIQCNDKEFLISEFHDQLEEMIDPPTPRALSVKLSKILNVRSETNKIRKHNKYGRGFVITLNQIIERLREILGDPLLFTD
jgi:hypothetical protein